MASPRRFLVSKDRGPGSTGVLGGGEEQVRISRRPWWDGENTGGGV